MQSVTRETETGRRVDRRLIAYRVVKEMTGDKVAKEIHDLFLKCAESILAGNSFKFDVPSRAAGNQHYVPELDRIVLKQNTSKDPSRTSLKSEKRRS